MLLTNVTAITDGVPPPSNDGSAIGAAASGGPLQVDAFNVIAQSSGPVDIAASGPKPAATIALRSSNYRTDLESGDATITDPGTGTNHTAPPAFVDVAAARVDIGADEIDNEATIRIVGRRLPLKNRRLAVKLRCPAGEASGPAGGRLWSSPAARCASATSAAG